MTQLLHRRPMTRATGAFAAALITAATVSACGLSGSSSAGSPAPSVEEYSPAGDIPDDQVFVPYSPPGESFTVKVPEGWSRTVEAGVTTFTDKLNSIQIQSVSAAPAPTVESARSQELPTIESQVPNYSAGEISSTQRTGGAAVLITYQADAPANDVTGKVVQDAVERYEFWKSETEVILTLSGPVGADNVDPWQLVSDSFMWK